MASCRKGAVCGQGVGAHCSGVLQESVGALTSSLILPKLRLCLTGSVLKGASEAPLMGALWTLMTLLCSRMTQMQQKAAPGSSSCRRFQGIASARSKTCSM